MYYDSISFSLVPSSSTTCETTFGGYIYKYITLEQSPPIIYSRLLYTRLINKYCLHTNIIYIVGIYNYYAKIMRK